MSNWKLKITLKQLIRGLVNFFQNTGKRRVNTVGILALFLADIAFTLYYYLFIIIYLCIHTYIHISLVHVNRNGIVDTKTLNNLLEVHLSNTGSQELSSLSFVELFEYQISLLVRFILISKKNIVKRQTYFSSYYKTCISTKIYFTACRTDIVLSSLPLTAK